MDISVRTESFGVDDQTWLGSAHGTSNARTVTLDLSAFTEGTHYPNGYFPSGLPLGEITASGLFGPYDNGALDGRETLAGFLLVAIDANTGDVVGALFEHGRVIEANLPIAIDAAAKADVAGQIVFV